MYLIIIPCIIEENQERKFPLLVGFISIAIFIHSNMPPKVDPQRRMILKELMVQSKLERITRGGCNKINPDQQCQL